MAEHYPFQKMELPYDYISLIPHCDADTLYIHHVKIYGDSVDALNLAISPHPQLYTWSLEELIFNRLQLPTVIENEIRHHAGAVYNHNCYFSGISDAPTQQHFDSLGKIINDTYGSLEMFKSLFREATESLLGTGWVWLVSEDDGRIHILITQNNQVPSLQYVKPIFVIDMWEHAYFLKYPAQLSEYVNNWFSVLDWQKAESRYLEDR